jgi:hypothetical protein
MLPAVIVAVLPAALIVLPFAAEVGASMYRTRFRKAS